DIDDQIGKYLNGLILLQMRLYFPDPWGIVSKDHGYPEYGRLSFGLAHQHVLDLYFETAKDALRQGLVVFIGRELAIGGKDIGRGDKVKVGLGPGEVCHHVLVGLYLGIEVSPQG